MELFRKPQNVQTRWISFENPNGVKGAGGMSNNGAKGAPCQGFAAGACKTLCDFAGSGVIRRMWLTISDRSPRLLRAVVIRMYWDNASTPAVEVPLGDFFGVAHGQTPAHENALFSNPQGRSFNCIVPMPFAKHARVTLTNESDTDIRMLFYEIDLEQTAKFNPDDLYFHAHWRRENPTKLCRDFMILPNVTGRGRFLGCNVGVIADACYGTGWWGEGEVKAYIDGDDKWPTLVGTGAEDYVGTGWGMSEYFNQYQGCSVADPENRKWAFYRYHIPDALYFDSACRVTIQSMGGMPRKALLQAIANGAPVKCATIGGVSAFEHPEVQLTDDQFDDNTWVNHYREDDYCATALFYLDRPENQLPTLASLEERVAGVSLAVDTARGDV